MSSLPADPFLRGGIVNFAEQLRRGQTSSEAVTEAFLDRIEGLDSRLGAFEYLAKDRALESARAIDRLLKCGTDLGPLMGVPVAVKDLFAVEGMPTTAGSYLEVDDLIGSEGSFVAALKRAGCVILGKTKTVEFAFGATGVNSVRGTPWNPWDCDQPRLPGGSSSGSAVAVAAGLCGFAIGSDTGGSVRIPAALCGIFGLKTTVGLWATDGVFPLSPSFDSIGPLTRSAADAALVYSVLAGRSLPVPRSPRGLRFGVPRGYFFENLDSIVAQTMEAALERLAAANAELIDIELPESAERAEIFPIVLSTELIGGLGRERFLAGRDKMDPVVARRSARGLEVSAVEYLSCMARVRELQMMARTRLVEFDGWLTPATPVVAAPLDDLADAAEGLRLAMAVTQNSQPGNLFGLCGTVTPIQRPGELPVGLQLLCAPNRETHALSMALGFEDLFGPPPRPDLTGFA